MSERIMYLKPPFLSSFTPSIESTSIKSQVDICKGYIITNWMTPPRDNYSLIPSWLFIDLFQHLGWLYIEGFALLGQRDQTLKASIHIRQGLRVLVLTQVSIV